jgi:hypothetical protein
MPPFWYRAPSPPHPAAAALGLRGAEWGLLHPHFWSVPGGDVPLHAEAGSPAGSGQILWHVLGAVTPDSSTT